MFREAMTGVPVLSGNDIAHFGRRGFVRLPEAFPREEARAMQAFLWDQVRALHGVERENRSTWSRAGHTVNHLNRHAESPVFRGIASPRLCGAIDQLLGPGTWDVPASWGGFFFTFPRGPLDAWALPTEGWHWDGNPGDPLAGLGGLFLFLLFADLKPRGGGTLFVSGSHRLIGRLFEPLSPAVRRGRQKPLKREFIRSHPWLHALAGEPVSPDDLAAREARRHRFMDEETAVDGVPVQVLEVTGEPGDVYLCHPSIFHAPSPNHRDEPRIMRIKALVKPASFGGQSACP